MSGYILVITIIGIASLGMAWFPSFSKTLRISYAVFYVLFGIVLYSIFINYLPAANPFLFPEVSIHLTELVVIISLMGSGLKIDQPFSFHTWQTPFRLVSVTMVLCIAAVAFLAIWLLHFSVPSGCVVKNE